MTGTRQDAQPATTDREIVVSRLIDARQELVFEAFTAVEHLSRWWGPAGFTTTTYAFEFHEGGVWDFVMHGPDGTDYPQWIMWTEIVPPKRITLLHGAYRDDPDTFESILDFTPHGATTQIVMRSIFPTRQQRDRVVLEYHAIQRGEQTLGKLAAYVAEVARKGAR